MRHRFTAFGLVTLALPVPAYAAPQFHLIAATGQQAPGTEPGTTFRSLGNPAMNGSGQVSFRADLDDAPAGADSGLWVDSTLLAREGDVAPGTGPQGRFGHFGDLFPAVINDDGMLAFYNHLTVPGFGLGSQERAIWAGTPGNFRLIALPGLPAPGLGAGARYRVGDSGIGSFISPNTPLLSDSGHVSYWVEVEEAGTRYDALYSVAPSSSPRFLVRGRHQAQEVPAGIHHAFFGRFPHIDGRGNVLFSSVLEHGTSFPDDSATYLATPGGPVRLVRRENDPVPGMPGVLWGESGGLTTLNEAGQTFFTNNLRNVPAGTSNTLWYGQPLSPTLIARAGEDVPGSPGHRFNGTFSNLSIDDSGRVAFTARADVVGSPTSGPVGLWTGLPGDFDLVLTEGSPAPGAPDGILINQFVRASVNADGLVFFASTLKGPGVTIDSNDALFAGTPGDLHLLVREGDLIEVAPGDLREVLLFHTPGLNPFHEYQLNDQGQVLVAVRFTDFTDAIFIVSVPEPMAVPMLAASLILLRHRRAERPAAT